MLFNENGTIKHIFESRMFRDIDWSKLDISQKFNLLKQIIPDVDYVYNEVPFGERYTLAQKAAYQIGTLLEKKGLTLYLVTDDERSVHFFAMDPKYENFIKHCNYIFKFEMFEPTYAEFFDMEE